MQTLWQAFLYIASCAKQAGLPVFIFLVVLLVIIIVSRQMSVRYNKPKRTIKPHNEIRNDGYHEDADKWMNS